MKTLGFRRGFILAKCFYFGVVELLVSPVVAAFLWCFLWAAFLVPFLVVVFVPVSAVVDVPELLCVVPEELPV